MPKTLSESAIETQPRTQGANPRQIRVKGFLPITVYGKGVESQSLQIEAHSFKLLYRKNPEATFELVIDGKKVNAVVQDIQVNYSTNEYLNVEFKLV